MSKLAMRNARCIPVIKSVCKTDEQHWGDKSRKADYFPVGDSRHSFTVRGEKAFYFCAHWCVCAIQRVWPLVWFTVAGLSGSGDGRWGLVFSIPPVWSSPSEKDVYFQDNAGIITVEVQRKWLLGHFIYLFFCLLSHRFWRLAALCFDFFLWLPVVEFALLLRNTVLLNVWKWVCECLQAVLAKISSLTHLMQIIRSNISNWGSRS